MGNETDSVMNQIRSEIGKLKTREIFNNIDHILININKAEQLTEVGLEVPKFEYRKGVKKRLAQKVSKILLRLLQIITNPQRSFNRLSIQSLKNTASLLIQVEQQLNNMIYENHEEITGLLDLNRTKIEELNNTVDKMNSAIHTIKLHVLDQERKVSQFFYEARKKLSGSFSEEQIKNVLSEEEHLLDAMYVSFENAFRGFREEIKERQSVYIPYIEKVSVKKNVIKVLDVGCGRGEFLELLGENKIPAIGIDNNNIMIEYCKERGLNVIGTDLMEFLTRQKENSYSTVTGFHIVEHLSLKRLIGFFDETFRVLMPGGMVIFETPNPENILVSTLSFYRDPTHINPLVPDTLKFISEERGFKNIEIKRLHRRNDVEFTGNKYVDELIHLANMEMDYALIGYKE